VTFDVTPDAASKALPASNFVIVLYDATYNSASEDANREIIKITSRSSNTLTISARDQEGTTHSGDWAIGAKYELTITRGMLDEYEAGFQPTDADLTAIAALSPTNDDVIQRKSGAWANRTMTQLKTDLGAGAASGLATLDGSSKVVQDPANATSTKTASKIPIADDNGYLNSWIQEALATTEGKIMLDTIHAIINQSKTTMDTLTLTPTNVHMSYDATTAMLFIDGTYLDKYYGTDTGYTPFKFEVVDAAGKTAYAYGGAKGAGLTYSNELLDAWTNNGYDTLTLSGTNITQAVEVGANNVTCYKNIGTTTGNLIKAVVGSYTLNSGDDPILSVGCFSNALAGTRDLVVDPITVGTKYYTHVHGSYVGFRNAIGTCDWSASGNSYKQVTDCPSTGLHMFTTKNGTTRGWTVTSGFNPNTISRINIYNVAQAVSYGTVLNADNTLVMTDGSAAADLGTTINLPQYVGSANYLLVVVDPTGKQAYGYIGALISGNNVKIVSAKGGSTQNWAHKDASFADNNDLGYYIFKE
jgi:hypothetical protein